MIDPFADLLRITEARSIVSGQVSAGGTWALRFPAFNELVFCAVTEGSCWLRWEGRREKIRISAGDVGLLPGNEGFVLCSDPKATPIDIERKPTWSGTAIYGDGSGCTWLAGRVALDPSHSELLTRSLPHVVHIPATAPDAAALRWIVSELVAEHVSSRPGASVATAHLAQVFFVKILRAHLAAPDALPVGILRAMADPRIVRALRLVHAQPQSSVGLDELARAAGMSRTRFAVHFKALAGIAPLAYVTDWRMRVACRALRDGEPSLSLLAQSLGYASDSAFSTAFKRVIGVAPGAYRERALERSRNSAVR